MTWCIRTVPKRELSEKATELPTGLLFDNDIIIHFLWIKAAKNRFQNVLIVMAAIEPAPNLFYIRLI